VVQDDYTNMERLQTERVLSKGEAEIIRSFNGLRNAIVHKYNHLDLEAVQKGSQKIKELYDILMKLVNIVEKRRSLSEGVKHWRTPSNEIKDYKSFQKFLDLSKTQVLVQNLSCQCELVCRTLRLAK
jgi:hypothetical protein